MAQEHSALASLRNASSAQLQAIVENYRQQRQSDVQELISIISEQEGALKRSRRLETKSNAWFAITLLGDIRSATATPLLARLIALRDSSFSLISNENDPHWYAFPAAVALSKIGMPAVEHLLEVARTAPLNSTAFNLSAVTLEAILSEPLALSAINQYAQYYPDLAQEERLNALTTLIQTGHKRWSADSAADFSLE